jgi:hypothetical protein
MTKLIADYLRAKFGRFTGVIASLLNLGAREEETLVASLLRDREPIIIEPERKQTSGTDQHSFYFRGAILDKLDEYFVILRKMKATDPEAFDLYSQVGAHVITMDGLYIGKELTPWWKENRPAFGCIAWVDPNLSRIEVEEKCDIPKFVYFTKYERTKAPPTLERAGSGDVYIATVYWHDAKMGGLPTEFGVAVLPDGSVRVLRSLVTTTVAIRQKHGVGRGCSTFRRRPGPSPISSRSGERNTIERRKSG